MAPIPTEFPLHCGPNLHERSPEFFLPKGRRVRRDRHFDLVNHHHPPRRANCIMNGTASPSNLCEYSADGQSY